MTSSTFVYDAALAFGGDWRRPVTELAAERLPGRSREFYESIAEVVASGRAEVESHVANEHRRTHGDWRRRDEASVDEWLPEPFPWMSRGDRKRGLRQGLRASRRLVDHAASHVGGSSCLEPWL